MYYIYYRDTAGQERYHSLAPMYYRGAQAAIVVYDITNTDTFERAKTWVKELQRQVRIQIARHKEFENWRKLCFNAQTFTDSTYALKYTFSLDLQIFCVIQCGFFPVFFFISSFFYYFFNVLIKRNPFMVSYLSQSLFPLGLDCRKKLVYKDHPLRTRKCPIDVHQACFYVLSTSILSQNKGFLKLILCYTLLDSWHTTYWSFQQFVFNVFLLHLFSHLEKLQ